VSGVSSVPVVLALYPVDVLNKSIIGNTDSNGNYLLSFLVVKG
jgi:hypothetical protein